jgi:hypothetical protein
MSSAQSPEEWVGSTVKMLVYAPGTPPVAPRGSAGSQPRAFPVECRFIEVTLLDVGGYGVKASIHGPNYEDTEAFVPWNSILRIEQLS